MTDDHEHRYRFLRQEMREESQSILGSAGIRMTGRVFEDVFYCEACLTYRRVFIRSLVPDAREPSGWRQVSP